MVRVGGLLLLVLRWHWCEAAKASNPKEEAPTWTFDYGSSARTMPAASKAMVFVPTWDGLHAVRSKDGVETWSRSWPGYGYETPPALSPDGAALYVVSRDLPSTRDKADAPARQYYIKALRATDGRELWRTPITGTSLGPSPGVSADGSVVYATMGEGLLVALDAKSGRQLWQSAMVARSNLPPVSSADGATVFAVSDTEHFTVQDAKLLHAFRASDGQQLWRIETLHVSPDFPPVVSPPGADQAAVYVTAGFTDEERGVYAYEASSGRMLWNHSHVMEVSPASLSPDGRTIFLGVGMAAGSGLVALRTSDGRVAWSNEQVHSLSPPSVTPGGQVVYAGYPGTAFYAVSALDGRVLRGCKGGVKRGGQWRLSPDGQTLYVTTLDYELHALRTEQCKDTIVLPPQPPTNGTTGGGASQPNGGGGAGGGTGPVAGGGGTTTNPAGNGGGTGPTPGGGGGGAETGSSNTAAETAKRVGSIVGGVLAVAALVAALVLVNLRHRRQRHQQNGAPMLHAASDIQGEGEEAGDEEQGGRVMGVVP